LGPAGEERQEISMSKPILMDKNRSIEELDNIADGPLGISTDLLIRLLERDGLLAKGMPTVRAVSEGFASKQPLIPGGRPVISWVPVTIIRYIRAMNVPVVRDLNEEKLDSEPAAAEDIMVCN
jgi:hypothetical protein